MFAIMSFDKIVQVNEKVRFDLTKSFAPKGASAISKVEIDVGDSYVDITGSPVRSTNWIFDYVFATNGTKPIAVRLTDALLAEQVFNFEIIVRLASEEKLLSTDQDLIGLEQDIMKWLPDSRSSFNYLHRKALAEILDWLDQVRLYKKDNTKLTADDLQYSNDLQQLSANWAMSLLYFDLSNKTDDKFWEKHLSYKSKVESLKARGRIQADYNGNEQLDPEETRQDFKSVGLIRR